MRSRRHRRRPTVFWTILSLLLINGLLILPSAPGGYPPVLRLSAEALVICGLVLALSRTPAFIQSATKWLLASIIGAIVLLKIAALAMRLALDRPLNLVLDFGLLRSVADLTLGAFGLIGGSLTLILSGLAIVGLWHVTAKALEVIARALPAGPVLGTGFVIAGIALSGVIWPAWSWSHYSASANRLVYEQTRLGFRTQEEKAAFRRELAQDSLGRSVSALPALSGKDVVLAFVESYGRSALEDPRFSLKILPRLSNISDQLSSAGLHSASAWLAAPTAGGQSWLSHATFLSGAWVDNNAKYQALLESDRITLIDLFEQTGHRSVAVMPAIIWPWPEGEAFGYDSIYSAPNLGYQAAPFNWVTMPDQFTLSAFERFERPVPIGQRQPVFAEIALISSHAPWTPIASLVDWSSVDPDGMVFDEMAQQGPTPAEVWSDRDQVRDHYAQALDYALEVLGAYAERFVDPGTLLIIVGDHQPARLLVGDGASRDVPIHIISKDRSLLAPFFGVGFVDGLLPDQSASSFSMADVRGFMVDGFGTQGQNSQIQN